MYDTELRIGLTLFLTVALGVSLATPLWWILPCAVALPVLFFGISWLDEYLDDQFLW
jgi:hypothetical protein